MNICPKQFDQPDPEDPTYSMDEIDWYASTPLIHHGAMPNHRLSLRKNLVTGKYEVYRQFVNTIIARGALAGQPYTLITNRDGELEEIALETVSLEEAIKFAGDEAHRYYGGKGWNDRVCDGFHLPALLTCPDLECYKRKTGTR